MKIFRTGSAEVVKNFSLILSFCRFGHRLILALRDFYKNLLENSLCSLFAANAARQPSGLELC